MSSWRLSRLRRGADRGAAVAGGNIVLAATAALSGPFLTRIFDASAFGIYGTFLTASAILAPILTLRLDQAIVVADERDAQHLYHVVLRASFATSFVIALAGLGYYRLTGTQLPDAFLFATAGVAAGAWLSAAWHWTLRVGSFRRLGASRAVQGVAVGVLQIGLGLTLGDDGLILGHALGFILSSLVLARPPKLRGRAPKVAELLRHHGAFPRFVMPAAVLNAASSYLAIVLIAVLASTTASGYYALTFRTLFAPITLVAQVMYQVSFRDFSQLADRPADIAANVSTQVTLALRLAWVPALALVAFGPAAFSLVFGPDWDNAGLYAAWMAPWLALVFAVSPIASLPLVLGRQRSDMQVQFGMAVSRFAALCLGIIAAGADAGVAAFALVSFLSWCVYGRWLLSISGASVAWRDLRRDLATGIVAVAILMASRVWMDGIGALALAFAAVSLNLAATFRRARAETRPSRV